MEDNKLIKAGRKVIRILAKGLMYTVFRVEVYNKEILKTKNFVLCSNHSHWIDPIAIGCLMNNDDGILAKKELFNKKASKLFLLALGAIPIDRKKQYDKESIEKSKKLLEEGNSLLVFVQGTRSGFDNLQEQARAGAVFLSYHAKTDILPVYVSENYKIGSKIKIVFGTPIEYPKGEKLTKNLRNSYLDLIVDGVTDCKEIASQQPKKRVRELK